MGFNTASEVISFSKKLEHEAAQFYEKLAARFPEGSEIFSTFAKENQKNAQQIERVYHSVITDAIEGCFAFNLEAEDYELPSKVKNGTNFAEALETAIRLEVKMIEFYQKASEQSQALMADIPRIFTLIARKRGRRVEQLQSLQTGCV